MKIKTSDLIGPALDWAVAKVLGVDVHIAEFAGPGFTAVFRKGFMAVSDRYGRRFHPSTDWAQGGPIIDRKRIGTTPFESDEEGQPCEPGWLAFIHYERKSYGPTALIAAMRCYVASKLGDEIEVPKELFNDS